MTAITIEGSSAATTQFPAGEKPVVVRVKRKSYQSRLDAFWLEINERPLKRPLLEFDKLSIVDDDDGDSSHERVEELKTKKLLVRHFETMSSSEDAIDFVLSVMSSSADTVEGKSEFEERKRAYKRDDKKEELLGKGRKDQEVLAQNARFEQIWRSHRRKNESFHDKLHDMCQFYDVIRVDEEESSEMQEQDAMSLEEQRILFNYVPLARELIPNALAQIESDISAYLSKQGCEFVPSTMAEIESDIGAFLPEQVDYVYDYYTAMDDMVIDSEDDMSPFPLVQVENEDFYDGPDENSEYESDDSNAEAHPHNDYPDEESEEEDKEGSQESTGESEEKEESDANGKSSDFELSRNSLYEDDIDYEDHDNFDYNGTDENYS